MKFRFVKEIKADGYVYFTEQWEENHPFSMWAYISGTISRSEKEARLVFDSITKNCGTKEIIEEKEV